MYFDTHAHYDDEAFDADRDELLSSLPEAGVTLVIDPGCDVSSSEKAIALAERFPHVYAAVGPSICGECYEVGAEVAEQFIEEFGRYRSERFLREKPDG